jgi:hypothetical protein
MDAEETICPGCGYDHTADETNAVAGRAARAGTQDPRPAWRRYLAGMRAGATAAGLFTFFAGVVLGAASHAALPGVPHGNLLSGALIGAFGGALYCLPAALLGALLGAVVVALRSTRLR